MHYYDSRLNWSAWGWVKPTCGARMIGELLCPASWRDYLVILRVDASIQLPTRSRAPPPPHDHLAPLRLESRQFRLRARGRRRGQGNQCEGVLHQRRRQRRGADRRGIGGCDRGRPACGGNSGPQRVDCNRGERRGGAELEPGQRLPHHQERVVWRVPKGEWTAIGIGADDATYIHSAAQSGKRYIYRIEGWSDEKGLGVSNRVRSDVE